MKDFMPNNWSAFAEWTDNFYTQMLALAPKYGLGGELGQLDKDNLWLQYWVQAKFAAKAQEKQLGDYVDLIANGETGAPQPDLPQWALPPNPPANIAPGFRKKIRSLARQIKANPIYTPADGALLGIVSPEEGGRNPEDTTPELKLRSVSNYGVEVDFRKYGLDAVRIEIRHKAGTWQLAAILTNSPGIFNVIPTTPGDAEQIEVRAVFLVKNQPFGNYSPIYTVVIQP